MKRVTLCYLWYSSKQQLAELDGQVMQQWLSELPSPRQEKVLRYVNTSDRIISLIATQLLLNCAHRENMDDFRLHEVHYPQHGKPCWQSRSDEFFDFNITHTDKLVVVAASTAVKVGIDAEKIRKLRSLKFNRVLSQDELAEIQHSPRRFFDIWSKKEAVIKAANTRGLARMPDVQLAEDYALLDNIRWYLTGITLKGVPAEQYAIQLATSSTVDDICLQRYSLSDLVVPHGKPPSSG